MTDVAAPQSDVVLSTQVSLCRNYADRPFDSIMSDDDAVSNVERVDRALTAAGHRGEFNRVTLNDMSKCECQWLLDRDQITPELFKRMSRGAAYIAKGDTISILVNEADHVRVIGMMPGLQLERAAELCQMADHWLDREAEFAYDDQFGYLTVDPMAAGSGLSFSVLMHLRTLNVTGALRRFVKTASEKGFTLKPVVEGKDEPSDSLYRLTGCCKIGESCEDMIEQAETTVLQLVTEERDVRQRLRHSEPLIYRDKAARALALIEAALLMSEREMRMRYSELRCAVMDKLLLVPFDQLDKLRLSLMNAALDLRTGSLLTERKRDEMRAYEFRNGLNRLIRENRAE